MEELVLTLITGIALPTLMMVVERHYKERPKDWEAVFVAVGCCLLCLGGAGFCLYLGALLPDGAVATDDFATGVARFATVIGFGWLTLFSILVAVVAWDAYKEAVSPPQPPFPPREP